MKDIPDGSEVKASASSAGDLVQIPGSGRSPGEGNGNPLQYPCWETPWTEEAGELQSMGLQRLGHECLLIFHKGKITKNKDNKK